MLYDTQLLVQRWEGHQGTLW